MINGEVRKTVTLRTSVAVKPPRGPSNQSTERLDKTPDNSRKIDIAMSGGSDSEENEVAMKDVDIEVPTSVMQVGICDREILMKLIVMTWIWVASQTCYSTINIYLKHLPGSIYLNVAMSGLAEIAAHVVVSLTFFKLTPRWTFFIGYCVALLGGVCLIW